MSKLYTKSDRQRKRRILRLFGLCLSLGGFIFALYMSYPLLSWKLFNEPALANQAIATPIPKTTILSSDSMRGLFMATADRIAGTDYTNAQNWYPGYSEGGNKPNISLYALSIPKIKIANAEVSTVDTDLKSHLINYGGTAVPPEKGNAVVFGHSTLPQLFNPRDYKTIFANAHKLEVGDKIHVTVNNVEYTYTIFNITVTDPEDTSVLAQQYDDSYLTLITCTPPGTIWKRLIIKSRLEAID